MVEKKHSPSSPPIGPGTRNAPSKIVRAAGGAPLYKIRHNRSVAFLQWAKTQSAACCICNDSPGTELHHYGQAGMGQKGSDYLICRVCRSCHGEIQGKRRLSFERLERLDLWANIIEDNAELLEKWAEKLAQS